MTSEQIQEALAYAYALCAEGVYEEELLGVNLHSINCYVAANYIKDLCYEVEEWINYSLSWATCTGLYSPKFLLTKNAEDQCEFRLTPVAPFPIVKEKPEEFKLVPFKPFTLMPDNMEPGEIYEYELNEEYPLMSRKDKLIARIRHWRYFRDGRKAAEALAYGFRGVYSARLVKDD